MTTVCVVSKPVSPPWNDATTVLVHGILTNRALCDYRFFGTPGSHVLEGPHVACEVVSREHRFQPTLGDHVRTLMRLARKRSGISVYHCLFTPNPKTSLTLKAVLRAKRRPIIHTLCSSTDDWLRVVPLLFADRLVTVSAWAKCRLEEHGVTNAVHIPPGITMPTADHVAVAALRHELDLPANRPCLLFSGDYEYSQAHPVILQALPQIIRDSAPPPVVIFACRPKTAEAIAIEADVRQRVDAAGLRPHVRFLGQIDQFASLLALASIVLFPVQSLRRKMDVPLTLLQALALRKPIVISTLGPLSELLAEPVGIGIPVGDARALSDAVGALLAQPERMTAAGLAGQALVESRYTADRMARRYEQLYLSLADDGAAQ